MPQKWAEVHVDLDNQIIPWVTKPGLVCGCPKGQLDTKVNFEPCCYQYVVSRSVLQNFDLKSWVK